MKESDKRMRSKKHKHSGHKRSGHKRSGHKRMRSGYGRRTRRYHGGVTPVKPVLSRLNPNATPLPPSLVKKGSKKLPKVRNLSLNKRLKHPVVQQLTEEAMSTENEVKAAKLRALLSREADSKKPKPRTAETSAKRIVEEIQQAKANREAVEKARAKNMERFTNEPPSGRLSRSGSLSRLVPMSLESLKEEEE